MRALILPVVVLLMSGCATGGSQWPLAHVATNPAPNPSAPLFDHCPGPDSAVSRVRTSDGLQLVPIQYVRSDPGTLCTVTPGGTQRWLDLLGMRFYQVDERQTLQPLARAVASLFPLEIGKKATAPITGNTTGGLSFMWVFEFEVVGRERIFLNPGPFDTYVIRLRERGQPPNAFSVDTAVWVEPRSRLPLRVRHQVNLAETPSRFVDWDATSILTR